MSNPKAQAAKDKGNAAFKAADYPTAIGHYTEAILADRKDPTYPLNRAAAYLKLGKFADAERDCNTVLDLSTNNVKGLFRRGQARFGLGQLENAKNDFLEILKREPSNAAAQEELRKTNEQIDSQTQNKKQKAKAPINPALAILDPKSSKTRRVPIRIVDSDGKPWTPSAASPSAGTSTQTPVNISPPQPTIQPQPTPSTQKEAPSKAPATLEAVSTRSIKNETPSSSPSTSPPASEPKLKAAPVPVPTPTPTPAHTSTPVTPSSTQSKPATFQDAKQAREAKTSRVGGGIFRKTGDNTIFETRSQPVPPKDPSSNPTAAKVPPPPKQEPPAALYDFAANLNKEGVVVKEPKTLVDFARMWNRSSLEDKWRLVNTIPATKFPELCSSSLESPLLIDILRVFATVLKSPTAGDKVKAAIMDYMVNFTKIKRFKTLLLFFVPTEKALAREVWELLGKRPEGLWASVA